ncbi:MAG: UDP-N-acetylglucosamine--N-acetylmuramyl-(pentapeptide) pyrophosphoryl-undecaprenol N-acetylglucosamine transferase, partial [Candidatus Levybacteria bacterium]|nr:UDP-N-acetylglucosamine--N-acetylmuramyl-(pentapeptide) pyrophosphoryl-undecaprenol N-acetylglucosamine transferase [Candidatus Levybacteria bacterium]
MKLVLTGGHLSPLLSVIDALPTDVSVLVVGRKYPLEGDSAVSLEYRALAKQNIPFRSIAASRLQRKWTRHTFASLLKFPYAFFQAFLILKEFSPDAVLSFGGYIGLPVTLASLLLRIPVVIHEQTLGAGFSNRIAAIWARKVCISWESSRRFFPNSKTVFTGNPIRKFNPPAGGSKFKIEDKNEKIPLIYITGGSAGSHAINLLVEGCLEKLLQKYKIIHQTGDAQKYRDFERLQKLKDTFGRKLKARCHLTKFINPEEVGSTLSQATLVVSRSGINTITELLFFGKPSLLIPLSFSQDNEQLKNASFLKEAGLAEVAPQDSLSSVALYELIIAMIK